MSLENKRTFRLLRTGRWQEEERIGGKSKTFEISVTENNSKDEPD